MLKVGSAFVEADEGDCAIEDGFTEFPECPTLLKIWLHYLRIRHDGLRKPVIRVRVGQKDNVSLWNLRRVRIKSKKGTEESLRMRGTLNSKRKDT